MNQQFIIPFQLPGLNQVNAANRANPYAGAKLKKNVDAAICTIIKAAHIQPVSYPCIVHMTFLEPGRRDADNVESAKKFILDALVKSGVIQNDSPKYVVGSPSFTRYVKGDPQVTVTIIEDEDRAQLHSKLRTASDVITEAWLCQASNRNSAPRNELRSLRREAGQAEAEEEL